MRMMRAQIVCRCEKHNAIQQRVLPFYVCVSVSRMTVHRLNNISGSKQQKRLVCFFVLNLWLKLIVFGPFSTRWREKFFATPHHSKHFLSQTNGLWDPQVLPGVLLAGWSRATWLHVGEVVMIIPLAVFKQV